MGRTKALQISSYVGFSWQCVITIRCENFMLKHVKESKKKMTIAMEFSSQNLILCLQQTNEMKRKEKGSAFHMRRSLFIHMYKIPRHVRQMAIKFQFYEERNNDFLGRHQDHLFTISGWLCVCVCECCFASFVCYLSFSQSRSLHFEIVWNIAMLLCASMFQFIRTRHEHSEHSYCAIICECCAI